MAHGWNSYIHSLSSDASTVRVSLDTDENLAQHPLIGHDFSNMGGSQGAPSSGSNSNFYPDPNTNPDFVQQKYYEDIPWCEGHQAVQEPPSFRDATLSDFATGRMTSDYSTPSLVDLNLHRSSVRQDCAMLNRSFLEYSDVSSSSSISDVDGIDPFCRELNNDSHLSKTQGDDTKNVPLKESVCTAVCSESSWAEKLPPIECEQNEDLGAAEERMEEERMWLQGDQPPATYGPCNLESGKPEKRDEMKQRDVRDRQKSHTKNESEKQDYQDENKQMRATDMETSQTKEHPDTSSAASGSTCASENSKEQDMDNDTHGWEQEKKNCVMGKKETCVQADHTDSVTTKNLPASESEMDAGMPDNTHETGQQPEEDYEDESMKEDFVSDSVSGTSASKSVSPCRSEMEADMPDNTPENGKQPEKECGEKSMPEHVPDSVSGTSARKSLALCRDGMDADMPDNTKEMGKQPEKDCEEKRLQEEHISDPVTGTSAIQSLTSCRSGMDTDMPDNTQEMGQQPEKDCEEKRMQKEHISDSVSGTPARKSLAPFRSGMAADMPDDTQEMGQQPEKDCEVKGMQEEHVPNSISETSANKSLSPGRSEVDDEQEWEAADKICVKQDDAQPMTHSNARDSLTTSVNNEPEDQKMACRDQNDAYSNVGFNGHHDDSVTKDLKEGCMPLSIQESVAIKISDPDLASKLNDCKKHIDVSECSSGLSNSKSQSQPELDWIGPIKMDTSSHTEGDQTSQEHCTYDKETPDLFGASIENARGPFQHEHSTNDDQDLPMLSADCYGEPLSGDNSESATEGKSVAMSESCSVEADRTEHKNALKDLAPRVKSSLLTSKCLHPIVLLKTMELKNNTEAFHCAECQHTTLNVEHIIEHHHSQHSLYKFQFCRTCDTCLTTDELAEQHLCGVDATKPVSHKCRLCFKTFPIRHLLIRHMRNHSSSRPFKCHRCGKGFKQAGNLNRHARMVRCSKRVRQELVYSKNVFPRNKANTDSPCDLPECFVKLTDIYKTNFCALCLKSYPTSEKLRKHNSNVHSKSRLQMSLVNVGKQDSISKGTEKGSVTRATRQHNILEAGAEKGEKYPCPLCSKVFNIFHNRARHMREQCIQNFTGAGKGKVGNLFQCPLCFDTFGHQSNRRRHLKMTCLKEYCSKQFRRRKRRQNPERNTKTQQAEQQKPPLTVTPRRSLPNFKCKLCPAVFAHYSGLYRHTKKHELSKFTGKMPKYRRSILPSQPGGTMSKDALPLKEDHSLSMSCKFCGKCFNTTDSLKKHVRKHRGTKPYRCVECEKCFAKEVHLLAHRKIHQRRIQCTVCRKILPTITELIQHRQSHTKKGVLQCPDCPMQFQYPVYLLRHMASSHQQKETLQDQHLPTHKRKKTPRDEENVDKTLRNCPLCTEVFASSKALRIHCLQHTESSSRVCPFCKRHFTQRQSMVRHMQVHTGEKPYSCQICKKRFFRNLSMRAHQSLCRGQREEPTALVNKASQVEPPVTVSEGSLVGPHVFMRKDPQVKAAVMSKPPQVKPAVIVNKGTVQETFRCLYCPRRFERESRFKMHLHSHKMNSLLRCSKCGGFHGKNKFKAHELNCKAVKDVYPCTSCGKNFARNCNRIFHEKTCKSLSTPQNSVGVGTSSNNQYKCPHCQSVFKYKSYLLRHLPTHNRETYACMHCGQRYTSQFKYLQHEAFCNGVGTQKSSVVTKKSPMSGFREARKQSQADGEGDYKCKFCTKSFLKSRNLRRHILTHTEVKPYRCKSCDSCFSRHDHLKRHQVICKGKRRRLQVCIAKVSLDDIGIGWQNKPNLLNDRWRDELHKCSICSKSFSTQSNLNRHMSMQHATRTSKKPFRCTHCGESFTREKSLRRHKINTCRMVPGSLVKNFSETSRDTESRRELPTRETNRILQRNQLPYERKLKYSCTYCPRSFKGSEAMKVHVRLHTGEKPYVCANCGEGYIRRDYLKRHSIKCNLNLDRALCERCGGVFSSDKLIAHQNACTVKPAAPRLNSGKSPSRSPPKGFSCANCSSRFLLFSQLQQHFISAHRGEITLKSTTETAPLHQQLSNMMSIKEESLDDGFGDLNLIVDNKPKFQDLHSDEMVKPLSCPQCNMCFVNNGELTRHMQAHAGTHSFTCKRCSKGFWNRLLYRKHIGKCRKSYAGNGSKEDYSTDAVITSEMGSIINDTVLIFNQGSQTTGTGVLQTNFSCKDDLNDPTQDNSTRNQRKDGSSDKNKGVHQQYQCSECDQSFTDGLMLISHLEDHGREEQQQKLATCQKCGKKCSSPGNLERHMRVHANEKSYSCPECFKNFLSSSDLDIHRTCHDPNRPFVCIKCAQRFWTSESLSNHHSEAHPEEAYTCHFCNKTYSHRTSLVRHCKLRHQTQLSGPNEEMEVTDQRFNIENNVSASDVDESNDEDEKGGSENNESDSDEVDFPCHVCGKTFLTSESLEDHQRCHLGEKPHECAECGKCFFQAAQLQQHLRSHKSEYQCQTCNRGFVSLFALRKHKHTHGKSRPHRCPKCQLSFTGPMQLAEHLATHRDDNFPCDRCDRTFSCKISRAEHRKIHAEQVTVSPSVTSLQSTVPSPTASFSKAEDLDYRCSVCNEHFKDPDVLSKHRCTAAMEKSLESPQKINVYGLQSNKPFPEESQSTKQLNIQKEQEYRHPCTQCHRSFTYLKHLRHHVKKHHGYGQAAEDLAGGRETKAKETDEEKIFKCPVCPHRFAQAKELSVHLTIHAKNTYECKICKRTYPSKSKLAEHERCHLTAATQYECTECSQSFFGSDAFRQHHCSQQRAGTDRDIPHPSTSKSTTNSRQAVEEELDVGEDFFNCPDCSKRFFLKHDLLEHQKKYHPSEQLFKCELCGKSFTLKKYLNEHLRRHRMKEEKASQKEKKLLKCSHCPKSFDVASDLQLHMRKHAEQEVGNHRCDMCYKSFSQYSRLKEHQESHVGQVVYECTDCDKAFTVLKLLEEHQKTHIVPHI